MPMKISFVVYDTSRSRKRDEYQNNADISAKKPLFVGFLNCSPKQHIHKQKTAKQITQHSYDFNITIECIFVCEV